MDPLSYLLLRAAGYQTDPRVPFMLQQADLETGTTFGVNRYKAVALRALHWLAMDDRASGADGSSSAGPTGGTLQSEQEGSLKRSYMVDFTLQESYPDLTMTRWGMELIGLLRKNKLPFFTRRVGFQYGPQLQ